MNLLPVSAEQSLPTTNPSIQPQIEEDIMEATAAELLKLDDSKWKTSFGAEPEAKTVFMPNSTANKCRSCVVGLASTDGAARRAHDELQARDEPAQDPRKSQAHDVGRRETQMWRRVVANAADHWRSRGDTCKDLTKRGYGRDFRTATCLVNISWDSDPNRPNTTTT